MKVFESAQVCVRRAERPRETLQITKVQPEQKGCAFLKFLNEENVLKHLEKLKRDQFNRTNQNKWPINCVFIFLLVISKLPNYAPIQMLKVIICLMAESLIFL